MGVVTAHLTQSVYIFYGVFQLNGTFGQKMCFVLFFLQKRTSYNHQVFPIQVQSNIVLILNSCELCQVSSSSWTMKEEWEFVPILTRSSFRNLSKFHLSLSLFSCLIRAIFGTKLRSSL